MRLLSLVDGIACILLFSREIRARPEGNPMESLGMAAMSMASAASSILESGAAMRLERGLKTDFFELQSKTEMGAGDAMRRPAADDDDDRRRKRSLAHPHEHRGKRSPCHTMGGGGGGTGGGMPADDVEEIARRVRAAKRRAAARAKKAKASKSKSKKSFQEVVQRKRRQAVEDAENEAANLGQKIAEHAKQMSEKIVSAWKSMVQGIQQMAEKVKGAISEGKGQTMPQDAETL